MKELVEIEHIQEDTWVAYLTEMFKKENEEPLPETPNIITEEKTEISQNDVKQGINKLKNRKSPGEDQIPNELLKYGGDYLVQQLQLLIQKIITTNRIPDEWRRAIMVMFFKKGDKKDPNNYRAINLLNTTLKLTTRIIATKINERISLQEEQQGFRTGRSCTDAVFVIRQIKEKSLEYNKPAYMCLIDLKKAFDRVRIRDAIHLLYEKGISLDLVKTIENIYKDNIAMVRCKINLSQPIKYETGIRQGDSLSPLIFNLIMDEIIKKVKKRRGYRMGEKEIRIICYADDAIITAENEDDLQRLIKEFEDTALIYNMVISTEKTKAIVISAEPRRCKLVVNNKIIEQVMETEYLGIKLSSYGKVEEEVQKQVNMANRAAGCLNNTIWRNKYLTTETKTRIYKSTIRPIMTYTAETRADTAKTQRLLETTEMKVLRKITNQTLRDRVRSEDIRARCGIEEINAWTKRRKVEWNQHIERMTENRIVRIARDKSPNGRRSLGRPRKRWSDNVN